MILVDLVSVYNCTNLISRTEQGFDRSLVLARAARSDQTTGIRASHAVVLKIVRFVLEVALAIRGVQGSEGGFDELLQGGGNISKVFDNLKKMNIFERARSAKADKRIPYQSMPCSSYCTTDSACRVIEQQWHGLRGCCPENSDEVVIQCSTLDALTDDKTNTTTKRCERVRRRTFCGQRVQERHSNSSPPL